MVNFSIRILNMGRRMGIGCKKWLHKELNHFHPNTVLDGKLLDEKGAPGAAWKCMSFRCTCCLQATFADCVVGGGEPTRGGAGHRCVALASLTRSNCRKAFSLPFFLSFNLQSEDCFPKQFFFPTAVLGVAFSSLRREHLRDLLRSQFFFFGSAFAGALLSFFLFYFSSCIMLFSLPRRGEFLSMVWKFVFLWIAWREGFGFAPSVFS